MEYKYMKNEESEQFTFLRVPKKLLTDEAFKKLSLESVVLYSLLLERVELSKKNNWIDEEGRVYIIFTLTEIMDIFRCSEPKAIKLLNELDTKRGMGLIERKRQGLCKPDLIYVKNFVL